MNDQRSSMSQAQTYEEMAEFWETHDTADCWDQFEEVELKMEILAAICADARKLPVAQQQEVLDFVQFLLTRAGQDIARGEKLKWSRAALAATMLAMDEEEGENAPNRSIYRRTTGVGSLHEGAAGWQQASAFIWMSGWLVLDRL